MKNIGSQAPFTILVANFDRPSSPEQGINAHKTRTGFRMSAVQSLGFGATMQGGTCVPLGTQFGLFNAYAGGAPTRPQATLTVVDNTFAGDSARLRVGKYTLVSNVHFVPGAAAADTAIALAAAISVLPGYTGTPAGADITVEGPLGALGEDLVFSANFQGGNKNYTFSWPVLEGFLGYLSNDPLSAPGVLP